MKVRLIIGIGPGKSGSTWLYTFLRSSKKICSSSIKETGYFLTTDEPSLEVYLRRFFDQREGKNIFAEVANTYIYHPLMISRLGRLDAQIDLVTILRDPIERAISHVRHLARNGEKFLSFEDALYRRPDILSRGLYAQYLRQFETAPQNVRVHVFDFNDLGDNEEAFREIFAERLDLDPAIFSVSEARRFKSAKPRIRTVALFVKWSAMLARQLGFTGIIQRVKDSWVPRALYVESKSTDFGPLSPATSTMDFMKEYFRHSDSVVGQKWGIDISKWKSQTDD